VPGDARELADSIYADLFGLDERDGVRRSLLRYYHGRSSLSGWLRSVLAQRAVDRARSARRTVSLDEERPGGGTLSERLAAPARTTPGNDDDPHRTARLALLRTALGAAIAALGARDRLRLALYYAQGLKLAQIGRVVGESEATVSRKLDRTRRELRAEVERRLRADHGLAPAQVAAALADAVADEAFDLRDVLPAPDS
jgi:RNA polymerase sigma factor (sigma-70 family)